MKILSRTTFFLFFVFYPFCPVYCCEFNNIGDLKFSRDIAPIIHEFFAYKENQNSLSKMEELTKRQQLYSLIEQLNMPIIISIKDSMMHQILIKSIPEFDSHMTFREIEDSLNIMLKKGEILDFNPTYTIRTTYENKTAEYLKNYMEEHNDVKKPFFYPYGCGNKKQFFIMEYSLEQLLILTHKTYIKSIDNGCLFFIHPHHKRYY